MSNKIKTHNDLDVYQLAFSSGMEVFEISKSFPKEERYSLIDQIRRSSRSVCANIAEGFRSRRYEKFFISKLTIAESEAAETQVWLEFALKCQYIDKTLFDDLFDKYDHIISMLVKMIMNPQQWKFKECSE